jgi:hypothetical protein
MSEPTPRCLGGTNPLVQSDVDDAIRLLGPLLKKELEYAKGTMIGTPINFAVSVMTELRDAMEPV